VWRSAVRTVRWLSVRGHPETAAVRRIGLNSRTVRGWEERWHQERLAPRARGRPTERPDQDLRNAILSIFCLVGPEITEEQLKEDFPDVARAELRELKRRYRAVWRKKGVKFVSALRWVSPGSVWAMDFTHPPVPVDGIFPALAMVRDLPSANQLSTLPTPDETAETTRDLLKALLIEKGAPLVLKIDNGPGLKAEPVMELLREHGILPLFSPPYTPAYNGAVETGNGTLKTHAHYAAARNDRPGEWTCDDVEEARLRGNALSRPHGRDGPTPDESWGRRMRITEADRSRFLAVYEEEYRKASAAKGILPLIGPSQKEKDSIDRVAISRALIRCGYLLIRRRRITPPVSQRKAARIS